MDYTVCYCYCTFHKVSYIFEEEIKRCGFESCKRHLIHDLTYQMNERRSPLYDAKHQVIINLAETSPAFSFWTDEKSKSKKQKKRPDEEAAHCISKSISCSLLCAQFIFRYVRQFSKISALFPLILSVIIQTYYYPSALDQSIIISIGMADKSIIISSLLWKKKKLWLLLWLHC